MRVIALFIFGLVVGSILACNSGNGDAAARTDVAVTLTEWEVVAEPSSVRAGEVIFSLANTGDLAHNFVIVKSDLPPSELPVANDAVDTSRLNLIGSAGPVAAATSMAGEDAYPRSLTPGKFVLFCDVVVRQGGDVESHYRNGMYTSFLVEP